MNDSTELTSIADLVDLVAALPGDGTRARSIIAIAGPPGAGKSTTADALVDGLNARAAGSASVLAMDGYHYDDGVLDELGWRARKGAQHTFDVAGLVHMLGRLQRNAEAEIAVPVFDRSIEIARAGAGIIPQSVANVVVEGNYLLLRTQPWDRLARFFDLSVFIDVPESELRRRLRQRWAELSGPDLDLKLEGNDMANVGLVQSESVPADITLALG